MNYEVVYEIGKFQIPTDLIFFLIMFICCGSKLFVFVSDVIEGERKPITFLFIIMLIPFTIITGIFTLGALLNYGGGKALDAKLYYSGEYSVVEGQIYNLEESAKSQMYYVDGECFLIGPGDNTIWCIKENGQQVRISYISGEENHIVKLEILE